MPQLGVIDLIRKHGIEPKKASGTKGGEYFSACPGCGDGGKGRLSDRFRIWPYQNEGQGGYWCRQCGKKGDAIQFLRDFDGLSFKQACERLGRQLPDSWDLKVGGPRKEATDWTPRDPESPGPAWQEHAKKLIAWAFDQLMVNPEQLTWLAARGISEAAVVRFGLGWVPDDLYRSREAWGLPELKDEKSGRSRPLWIPHGLAIPWFNGTLPIRIRIRRADPVEFGPRYYMVPGSSSATMLLRHHQAKYHPKTGLLQLEVFVVVESELDAIMLNDLAPELCGVVALGSVSAHPDVTSVKILSEATVIMNALDYDTAGGAECGWWRRHFSQARRWPAVRGKDPGEMHQMGISVREWLKEGLPEGLKR